MKRHNHQSAHRLAVLFAADDSQDVALIRRACEGLESLQCSVVSDGDEALAYLAGEGEYADRQTHPFPDILFLDHRLPCLSGLGMLCLLRSGPRLDRLPVAILTKECSSTQVQTLSRLNAACCTKRDSDREMMMSIEQSIGAAFRAVGQLPSPLGRRRAAPGVGTCSNLPCLELAARHKVSAPTKP